VSLKLNTREQDGVVILDLAGKLTLGEATAAFRNKVHELESAGYRRLLVNLAGVSFLDSSGIGELVGAYTLLSGTGGEIKLVHLAKRTHDLLKVTKLYSTFETFEDEAAALASFPAAARTAR
jgi:anti-sigma B factor antagonist